MGSVEDTATVLPTTSPSGPVIPASQETEIRTVAQGYPKQKSQQNPAQATSPAVLPAAWDVQVGGSLPRQKCKAVPEK
jgi:hypothetical protein